MKHIRGILSSIIILALIASGGAFMFSQAQVARATPFSESADAPRIAQPDASGTGLRVAGEMMDFSGTHAFTPTSADAKDASESERAKNADTKTNATPEGDKSGANVSETGAVDGSLPGDTPQATDVETEREYFTTSIKDGDTVHEREYEFTIRHLIPALQVVSVQTFVNAHEQSQWQGRITLDEGINKVRVSANYADPGGKVTAVYRDYTLYYYPGETSGALTIHTSLTATTQADPFIIHGEDCEFQASVTGGSGAARLTVVFDGVTLKGSGGTYRAAIQKANKTVTVRLRATDSSADVTEYYYVKYIPVADEATAPRVRYINVTNGMSITGEDYTLDVDPVDYRGNAIGYQGVAVRLNGALVDMRWMNEYLSYALVFDDGANRIGIRLTDGEGRYADYSYEITCKKVGDGEPLGTITVSMDATVLGLGYIIPPTAVEIYQGETGAMVVDRLLADKGFTYTHTGSFTSNFYLARIKRTGVGAGVAIPANLLEALHGDGYVENGNQDNNSLGEKDHFEGSGWMYAKNGSFPGYGFTDTKLKDGDVVKIRYTLAYGKDIGGGQSSGGSASDNYGKVW